MNESNLSQFKELYEKFKLTEAYKDRVNQSAVAPVLKEIIKETLKNDPFTNEHLTGFIQMFKFNCRPKSFSNYLHLNILDKAKQEELSEWMARVNQKGYTNAGRAAIKGLSQDQLNEIKLFLQKAFTISNVEEAVKLCEEYDAKKIPMVTSGIYSPWLYYINPQTFPLINNSHNKFREWLNLPADYPAYIKVSNQLKELVNETDLGVIDFYAYSFDPKFKLQVLDLQGKKLYKMSHGIFLKEKPYKDLGIIKHFEQDNLIVIGKDTKKGQVAHFIKDASIGDIVYVCYGGTELYCVGKIISDSAPLSEIYAHILKDSEEWLYRNIEPIYFPTNKSITTLTDDSRAHMPSGYTTFYEVPKNVLEDLNDCLFIPNFNLEIIDTTLEDKATPNIKPNSENINKNTSSMNTILYGPPGTGKTYSTIDESLKILGVEITAIDRKGMKNKFAELQKKQRVFFTTFHQNMAYEDFIEGIKPIEPNEDDEFLKYEIQDGLFMKACVEATFNYIQSNFQQEKEVEKLIDFNGLFDTLAEKISNNDSVKLKTKSGGIVTATITTQGNFSIKHQDSERPYTVSKDRLSKLYEVYPDPSGISNVQDAFRKTIGGCNSTAYWSVLNELVTIRNSQPGKFVLVFSGPVEISYSDKRKIVQQYWDKKDYTVLEKDNSNPYVFIIDEINRGNVAQIFGELITLIEEDKRMGKLETLYAELPYSKHSFSVPPNLYIIGTMNTADRSVEALDAALRRRFSFIPKMPEYEKLKVTDDGVDLKLLLFTINERLKILKDQDHTIGHAWLWNVKNLEQLQKAFGEKILPLLQEYFYHDYEKLGLVIGDNFFERKETVPGNIFAKFTGVNGLANQYDQSWIFELKPSDTLSVADFQSLYQ